MLPQSSQEATFHIDHILPRVAGGETVEDNLALACVSCSLRKGARTHSIDSDVPVRIFDPRTDDWNKHFILTDDYLINGLTATGRATVQMLAMNRPAIVAIRKELDFFRRYPPF
jgi:hypothetical protein